MKIQYLFILIISFFSCSEIKKADTTISKEKPNLHIDNTSIVILGTIQDAGSPQIACKKKCCAHLFENPDNNRQIVSLGLVDADNQKTYLFDATPDIGKQMKRLTNLSSILK